MGLCYVFMYLFSFKKSLSEKDDRTIRAILNCVTKIDTWHTDVLP